jgi:hypothetical protein
MFTLSAFFLKFITLKSQNFNTKESFYLSAHENQRALAICPRIELIGSLMTSGCFTQ